MLKKYDRSEVKRIRSRLKRQLPYKVPNSSVMDTINKLKIKAERRQLGDYDPLYNVIDKYANPIEEQRVVFGGWANSKGLVSLAILSGLFIIMFWK